jgi:hypothetical protein
VFATAIGILMALARPQQGASHPAVSAEQGWEQTLPSGVRIVTDRPADFDPAKPTLVVFYALPNGNTIEETEGRRPKSAAEWRFDIQHIAAQTRLLRRVRPGVNIAVVYLQTTERSWPLWRRGHPDAPQQIRALIENTLRRFPGPHTRAALAAHSGGGSLIFGLLDSAEAVPEIIERIVFLDADYDYTDTAHHGEKLIAWLHGDSQRRLVVLAYDDRTVTLDGKPIVSSTGGTYRATHRLMDRLQKDRALTPSLWQDFDIFEDHDRQIGIAINRNYANRILHTALVGDMNGFLYAMTFGPPAEGTSKSVHGAERRVEGAGAHAGNTAQSVGSAENHSIGAMKPDADWGHLGGPRAYTRFIEPAEPQSPDTIPARPRDAVGGATFMRRLAMLTPAEREAAIRDEIEGGNLPDFLRGFRTVSVQAKDGSGHNHTATFEVMPDYLAVGSDDDFYRVPMTPATAQQVADRFGCTLPTRKMVDLIYAAAEVKLAPRPLVQEREAVTTFVQHNTIIEEQRTGSPLGPIVAGIQKDLVITNRLLERPGRVAIYGWHRTDGAPIQPLTTVHAATYVDYSHGARLIKRRVLVDGHAMDLWDLLKAPDLAGLLSDEGPIPTPHY